MSLSIFTHPCQRPESLPLCKVSFSTFPPPTSVTYMSVSSKSGSKTPKSDQAKCHAPFSSREHVGSIMSNMSFHDVMSRHDVMSFHDVMSRHVVMSCHVVTLETDPCVCHCQYSPTHVKDQNPCLCAKCHFQPSHHPPQSLTCRSRQSLARKRPKSDHDLTRPLTPQESVSLY